MTAQLTHCIFDSQVSCIANVMLAAGLVTLRQAVSASRWAVRASRDRSPYLNANLASAFYRRNLAHKGLGLTIDAPYRHIRNLLYG